MKRKIALLGSTGSIGTQTLQVVDEFLDDYQIVLLSAYRNAELLKWQALKYRPFIVATSHRDTYYFLMKELAGTGIKILYGEEELINSLGNLEIDLLIGATAGFAGVRPVLTALELGIDVALANKETIVVAGELVRDLQKKHKSKLIPVDSEHSAIFQCLEPDQQSIEKIILTASGGPFRSLPQNQFSRITPEKALNHPNWKMGRKITIDSATLMNKGLEVIEAHFLFDLSYEQIEVIVHPQSIIHSMVQYVDGSVLAQLGLADMRIPIQYALTYPARRGNSFAKIDFCKVPNLEFFPPDTDRFPCLKLAYEAGKIGFTMPAVMNAANEVAVEMFLNGEIAFTQIANLVEWVMEAHLPVKKYDLKELLEIDSWARDLSARYKFQG